MITRVSHFTEPIRACGIGAINLIIPEFGKPFREARYTLTKLLGPSCEPVAQMMEDAFFDAVSQQKNFIRSYIRRARSTSISHQFVHNRVVSFNKIGRSLLHHPLRWN